MAEQKYFLPEGRMEFDGDMNALSAKKRDDEEITILTTAVLSDGTRAHVNIRVDHIKKLDLEMIQSHDKFMGKPVGEGMSDFPIPPIEPGEDFYEKCFERSTFPMLRFVVLEANNWIIMGSIRAGEDRKPIFIFYSELMKIGFYSIRRKTDVVSESSHPFQMGTGEAAQA